jgi:hypothetical protein
VAWNVLLDTLADADGNFGAEAICSMFKLNSNGFRCFDKPKPPATKELAIQRFASEYPPATLCEPLKLNSPFQCTRNVEVPATTRSSLSVAAAQAVFALAGNALVALLGNSKSRPRRPRRACRLMATCVPWYESFEMSSTRRLISFAPARTSFAPSSGQGTREELIQKLLSKK